MKNILFYTGLVLEGITCFALAYSKFFPTRRIWPPLARTWQRWLLPVLFVLTAVDIIALGLLDWGSRPLSLWLVVPGILLWLLGNLLALWTEAVLGRSAMMGGRFALVTHGPFRWSRNPQYVGFILALAGWGLMTSSRCTLIAAAAACVPLLLVPCVEEPWLLEVYGEKYSAYSRTVPRFFRFPRR